MLHSTGYGKMALHKLVRGMGTFYRRTPKRYDGTVPTTHRMGDLLPLILRQIGEVYQDRPDLVLALWPEVIGEKLAPMTQAISFSGGILTVRVRNSTLFSLLKQRDKPKLLQTLRQKLPRADIKNIFFRLG